MKKVLVPAVLSLALFACSSMSNDLVEPSTLAQTTTTTSTTAITALSAGPEMDKVVRIVDGDTIETVNHKEKIRLIGIDTPELHKPKTPVQCFAQEAADHLSQLIPPGSAILVTYDKNPKDRYGRTLAYVDNPTGVATPTGDVGLNQIENGFAVADYVSPNKGRRTIYAQAMTKAKDAKLGMWSACKTQPPAKP